MRILWLQDGWTALMAASSRGSVEFVNALIEALPAADRKDTINARAKVRSGQDVASYLIDHR